MFESVQQDELRTANLETLSSLFKILFYAAALHLVAPLVPSGWRWLPEMPLDLILAGGGSLLRLVQWNPVELTIMSVSGGILLLLRSHLKTSEEAERHGGEEEAAAGSSQSNSTGLPVVQNGGG